MHCPIRFRAQQWCIFSLCFFLLSSGMALVATSSAGTGSDEKLRSFVVTMNGSWFGDNITSKYTYLSPHCFRMDLYMEVTESAEVCNGSECWSIADGEVGEMDEEDRSQLLQELAELTGDIEALRAYYGAQVEATGETVLDGVPVITYCLSGMDKLDPELRDFVRGALYVESSTGLPKRLELDYTAVDGTHEVFSYGIVDGCAIVQTMELFSGEERIISITVEKVIINGPIDIALFERP